MSPSLPDSVSRESWSSVPEVSQSTAQQLSSLALCYPLAHTVCLKTARSNIDIEFLSNSLCNIPLPGTKERQWTDLVELLDTTVCAFHNEMFSELSPHCSRNELFPVVTPHMLPLLFHLAWVSRKNKNLHYQVLKAQIPILRLEESRPIYMWDNDMQRQLAWSSHSKTTQSEV